MIQQRAYFFTGVDGASGVLFRKNNHPTVPSFVDLFDSILFKAEAGDTATEINSGHARIASASNVITRSESYSDANTRFVKASHLPGIYNSPTADHITMAPITAKGITITPLVYSPGGITMRGDWMLSHDIQITSSDDFVTVAETPAGSGHFVITAGSSWTGQYKVLADSGGTPGYLDAVMNSNDFVVTGHIIGLRLQDSDSIALTSDVSGLKASIILDGTTLVETVSGLSLNNPTTYVRTTGDQAIAGIKTFSVHPQISVYAAPTILTEYTPKKYVDDLDATCVHLDGSESITGTKVFSLFPQKGGVLSPTLPEEFATKYYVDQIGLSSTLWEVGSGVNSIKQKGASTFATGNYSLAFGYGSSAAGTGAIALGYHITNNGGGVSLGKENTITTPANQGAYIGCYGYVSHAYSYGYGAYGRSLTENSCFDSYYDSNVIYNRTMLKGQTTDGATLPLALNLNNGMPIKSSTYQLIEGTIMGLQTGGTSGTPGDMIVQKFELVVKRRSGTVSILETQRTSVAGYCTVSGNVIYHEIYCASGTLDETPASVTIDDVNKLLVVTVAGQVDKTIDWRCHIKSTVIDYSA
jgi:hypothetical protein